MRAERAREHAKQKSLAETAKSMNLRIERLAVTEADEKFQGNQKQGTTLISKEPFVSKSKDGSENSDVIELLLIPAVSHSKKRRRL